MIDWDPTTVLACLETEPAVDEESYRYSLTRDGVVLALEVWHYQGDVSLAIRLENQETPFIEISMLDCREIRYVKQPHIEELHFVTHTHGFPSGWRLQIRPHIMVKITN